MTRRPTTATHTGGAASVFVTSPLFPVKQTSLPLSSTRNATTHRVHTYKAATDAFVKSCRDHYGVRMGAAIWQHLEADGNTGKPLTALASSSFSCKREDMPEDEYWTATNLTDSVVWQQPPPTPAQPLNHRPGEGGASAQQFLPTLFANRDRR